MYVSGGWDRTMRLWFEPPGRQAHALQRRGPWGDWGALPSSAASQARAGTHCCRGACKRSGCTPAGSQGCDDPWKLKCLSSIAGQAPRVLRQLRCPALLCSTGMRHRRHGCMPRVNVLG